VNTEINDSNAGDEDYKNLPVTIKNSRAFEKVREEEREYTGRASKFPDPFPRHPC